MKTIIMTLVLLLSTQTFAREAGDSTVADRLELRNDMKKEIKMNDSTQEKLHCRSQDYKDQTTGC